ncbi:Aldo/keto reductase [Linderina pennispora]|uniref:Aldo/keto reductase n=1 Tax=Linderina pennispora TaxID=61395 RepID=A0A1Y1VYA6_9FUNG|nr:Aldo/keto reductase [Linderina pennispora]ORX66223.1 Aldo/keto reductase [Linderina pennispora]
MAAIPTVETGVPGDHIKTPRIGLECMPLSGTYGSVVDAESLQLLGHAHKAGCTLWDTTDLYGFGHEFTVPELGADVSFSSQITGIRGGLEYVRTSIEGSLKRLGVDRIGLYYQHRVDPNTPIEKKQWL